MYKVERTNDKHSFDDLAPTRGRKKKGERSIMSHWESNAIFVQKEYGAYVDFEERFYNCPFCDEPIYEDDWADEDYGEFLCPICEDYDGD